nr:DNA alkylation repair protein [Limnochorda pilosa]
MFQTNEHELHSLGVALLERYVNLLEPADLRFVEGPLRRCHTWDLADWLSTKVAALPTPN